MPRTSNQITASQIATLLTATSQVSNFNQGSLVRSILDADSAEDALIEQEIFDQVASAILNAQYQALGITPLSAVASVYQLQYTNTNNSPQTLSAGQQATIPSSSLIWTTLAPVTVPAAVGSTPGTAPVNGICLTTGSATNVPANSITVMVTPISGLSVTNPFATAIIAGANVETQTQTQARAANQQATIHRGDDEAIEAGVLKYAFLTDSSGNLIEQVVKCVAVDYVPGESYIYAVNGLNGLSSDMSAFILQILYGYTDSSGAVHTGFKAGGVIPSVFQAVLNSQVVSVQVLPLSNTTLLTITPQVQTAISAYFTALDIEQKFSFSDLINAIKAVAGVDDVVVISPAASLPGVPYIVNPSVAPVCSPVSGSTVLAEGTYKVAYSWVNAWGQTLVSSSASVSITAGEQIQVGALNLPVGATGVNYYLSVAAGSSTLGYDSQGSGALVDLTALPATGAASVPGSNTAQVHGNLYVVNGTPAVSALAS